jgi:DNA-binding NarL/FixJ family response regulator
MEILVLSRSYSFERHVNEAIGEHNHLHVVHSREDLHTRAQDNENQILLAHISSCKESLMNLLLDQKQTGHPKVIVGVAADKPQLREMLALSQYGIRAYFNSYMADLHFQTMLRHLVEGQTWFAPDLLSKALEVARLNQGQSVPPHALDELTDRERDVAIAVSKGMSNKQIATNLGISERTVKTHLTRVFEKMNIKDRVALAIMLSGTH